MGASVAVEAVVAAVRSRTQLVPRVGIVLGSGLGGVADEIEQATTIPVTDLPGLPAPRVPGHEGRLVFGSWAGVPVAALRGRIHLYEGHAPDVVVLPTRALVALGAKTIVLTNAAGGLREAMQPGDLGVIVDHLNLTGRNALVGANDDRLGPRFPDLTAAWDPHLARVATATAEAAKIPVHRVVYAQMLGPSYETPAEVRWLASTGADVVGMSTAIEAIAARHMGARLAGISCITNRAAGLAGEPLAHADVEAVADRAAGRLRTVLRAIVEAAA